MTPLTAALLIVLLGPFAFLFSGVRRIVGGAFRSNSTQSKDKS